MPRRSVRNERWSSDETGSIISSGSSVDTRVGDDGWRGQRSWRGPLFTHGEERRIRRSLQRKLLSNNGSLLSRIERRLLRADDTRKGTVSIATFKAALTAQSRHAGVEIVGDEVRWLIQKLRGRNSRNVAILKMRLLVESETEQGHPFSRGGEQTERHHRHRTQRDRDHHDTKRNNSAPRRQDYGSNDDDDNGGRAGSAGRTISESDDSSHGGASLQRRRSSPPPPATWATQQGTVGQWLHEVAAPMERKLFFEFLRDLEKFENRNGLDHYRVRPSAYPTRHHSSDDDDGWTVCRGREDGGSTVIHLGPMLKASIRFYV